MKMISANVTQEKKKKWPDDSTLPTQFQLANDND